MIPTPCPSAGILSLRVLYNMYGITLAKDLCICYWEYHSMNRYDFLYLCHFVPFSIWSHGKWYQRFYVVVISRTAYTTILPFRSPGSSTYSPALYLLFLQGYRVRAPFPDITGHIIEAPSIGFLLADSMKPVPAVVFVPGHLVDIVWAWIQAIRSGMGGIVSIVEFKVDTLALGLPISL